MIGWDRGRRRQLVHQENTIVSWVSPARGIGTVEGPVFERLVSHVCSIMANVIWR
jgi:hypothetical protein